MGSVPGIQQGNPSQSSEKREAELLQTGIVLTGRLRENAKEKRTWTWYLTSVNLSISVESSVRLNRSVECAAESSTPGPVVFQLLVFFVRAAKSEAKGKSGPKYCCVYSNSKLQCHNRYEWYNRRFKVYTLKKKMEGVENQQVAAFERLSESKLEQ